MIQEAYCSYEVSELLKEKGFECECKTGYFNGSLIDYTLFGFCDGEITLAPSLAMAMAWFRKEHQIAIVIDIWFGNPKYCNWFAKIMCYGDNLKTQQDVTLESKDTYEEAVESALLYTLKNII